MISCHSQGQVHSLMLTQTTIHFLPTAVLLILKMGNRETLLSIKQELSNDSTFPEKAEVRRSKHPEKRLILRGFSLALFLKHLLKKIPFKLQLFFVPLLPILAPIKRDYD